MNWVWQFPQKPVKITERMFRKGNWSDWQMEAKADGFRCILTANQSVKLWTREHNPITIPDNLREQIEILNLPSGTVLDGEIWTMTKRGSWRHDNTVPCNLSFWDAVHAGSKSLCQERLEKRQEILAELIGDGTSNITVLQQLTASIESFEGVLKLAKDHYEVTDTRSGFIHGVVLKKRGSLRRDHPTRSIEHPDWLKVCFWQSGEVK